MQFISINSSSKVFSDKYGFYYHAPYGTCRVWGHLTVTRLCDFVLNPAYLESFNYMLNYKQMYYNDHPFANILLVLRSVEF